ncbi:phage protease [Alloalcanivorax xenomutans]|uniref:phage protease n=1 Tax=Alloalcanivorax xenomutans TaxID=1094342 RepID=UPI003C628ACD
MIYSTPTLADQLRALCREEDGCQLAALNFELPADGSVPDWLELLPAGETLEGRDGRAWRNPDPAAVVRRTRDLRRDIPLDWEHATELKAPKGDRAPAAAWIKELEVRDGAVWGRVEWTEDGAESVGKRHYRYISPVFLFQKDTLEIQRITSAGLTNQPNLYITALNQSGPVQEDSPVKLSAAIRNALGLKDDATEDDGVQAINQMKQDKDAAEQAKAQAEQDKEAAINRATPSLDKFVPRADYDSAMNRTRELEQKLKERDEAELEGQIDAAINQALDDGKITPATADYHKAQCRQEGGLERFKAYVEAAPKVADDSDLDTRKPEAGKDTALNQEEARVAALFGNSAEDLKKYGG